MVQQLSTNTFTTAKWIVSANAADGTHTTIAAALTSASSGDTIFIRPGTYTENLTLKAGVNLAAYGPTVGFQARTVGNVIISGKCSFSAAGKTGISGITLQTNGDYAVEVTGSNASIVLLQSCFLNCTNNTGLNMAATNTSAVIEMAFSGGDITTTGIALWNNSGTGAIRFVHTTCANSGGSTTNNTCSSSGGFFPNYSSWANGITLGSTSQMVGDFLDMTMSGNQTAISVTGTGGFNIQSATVACNTASCFDLGAGSTSQIHNVLLSSSNANTITGSGTLVYSIVGFNSVSNFGSSLVLAPWPTAQGWSWIDTQVASASAQIDFTQGLTSYSKYILYWDNVVAASGGGQALRLLYNQGAGFVTSGYSGNGVYGNTAGGPGTITTVTTYGILGSSLGSSVPACSGSCIIGNTQYANSQGATYHSSVSNDRGSNGIGIWGGTFGNTAAITQLRVAMASGNISTGTFTLYGLLG